MAKLTKRVVDAAGSQEREYFLWDDLLPGFGLRVLPSGRKTYVVQYRQHGRTRRLALGPHGVLTTEQARNLAADKLYEVKKGGDPSEERHLDRAAKTVAELAEAFMSRHGARLKRKTRVNYRVGWDKYILPALGRRKLASLSRADVQALHRGLSDTPYMANRVLALLSSALSFAAGEGWVPEGFNPCRGVQRYKERNRKRYLSGEELGRLGTALAEIEQEGSELPSVVPAIRLLLLTGARLGEVLSLKWDYLDRERGVLRLPDSKTGEKEIPVGAAALAVLEGLPRRSEWVFPGRRKGQPLTTLRGPWDRLCRRAELEGLRIHDLRHGLASVGVGVGFSLALIGGVLGQRSEATIRRYAHLQSDPLEHAVDRVSGETCQVK